MKNTQTKRFIIKPVDGRTVPSQEALENFFRIYKDLVNKKMKAKELNQ
jgi:hypothetical protein